MRRIVEAVGGAMAVLAATAVALIMLTTVTDVVRRTVTGRSLPGTVDYGELLMVAAVFLALAYAQRRREHVSVALVTSRLPPGVARWLRLAGLATAIVFVAWLTVATGQEALRSFARNEFRFGLVRVPVWPARAVVPLGALALLAQLLADAAGSVRGDSDPAGPPGSTPPQPPVVS